MSHAEADQIIQWQSLPSLILRKRVESGPTLKEKGYAYHNPLAERIISPLGRVALIIVLINVCRVYKIDSREARASLC